MVLFLQVERGFPLSLPRGAVPVILTELRGSYALTEGKPLDAVEAISIIESFIKELWDGSLKPAMRYIQEAELPIILTYASDGTYARAMQFADAMEEFIYNLGHEIDDAANMDW